MRFALSLASMLFATNAFAGGVGLVMTGGAHQETVTFYSNSDEAGALEDWKDYPQYQMVQTLPNMGGGIEFILGDRDDRFIGVFRGYYQQDASQLDPRDAGVIPADQVVGEFRATPRNLGVAQIGINWGFLGNTDGFLFGATAHVGSGFLTSDHTEFLLADAGVIASYRLNRQISVFTDLVYTLRVRKGMSSGANGYLGVRYMFD
jgi:hypothetical protein